MDLRSVLNNSDAGDRDRQRERERERDRASSNKQPPTPQQQPHQLPQHHQQTPPSYPYREFGHQPAQAHPSPGKPAPQDYPPRASPQPPPGSYPLPQSPYQQPSHYPGRPTAPPLQSTNSFHDVRSPSAPMLVQSPTAYRPNATSTAAPPTAAGGYPLPSQETTSTSPSMRHQYPPTPYQQQRQDSYSHGSGSFTQQPSITQVSPVATPGRPYAPQRSQSTHSTPTPTSAHSQNQYGPPFAHGSPVAATRPLPAEHSRQPSQPPTPLGPPLSASQRQPIGQAGYAQQQQQQEQQQHQPPQTQQQPSSPHQQRVSSLPGSQIAQSQTQTPPQPPPQQLPQQQQQQPQHQRPPSQSSHQRMSSTHSTREPATESQQRPLSFIDRESSLSVSPKTRVPSLPSNPDRQSISSENERKPSHERKPSQPAGDPMVVDYNRAVTPAKRKLDSRGLSPRELEHKERRPPPGKVNGEHVPARDEPPAGKQESTRKTRVRRAEPPIWAQSIRTLGNKLPKHANFVLQKRAHTHLNGTRPDPTPRSRHPTPEKTKARSQPPPPAAVPVVEPGPQDILGPWEASITGVRPYEEVSRVIADFLFVHVVNSEDMQEISSRGIKFEVEAKLGTLIDKDTNHRVERALESEVILQNTGRVAFKSSMTEVSLMAHTPVRAPSPRALTHTQAHHKSFNDFLNQIVVQTHPQSGRGRVQLEYKHRREIDRFIELPLDMHARIPGCMRSRLGSRARSIRVRLTYDQKTKEVLGKIIKARVADIDLHMPSCPMDCRVSINLEMDWDGSVQELEQLAASQADRQPDRSKDRLSYTHGHYQIDLTQVTQQVQGPGVS